MAAKTRQGGSQTIVGKQLELHGLELTHEQVTV